MSDIGFYPGAIRAVVYLYKSFLALTIADFQ